MDWETFGGVIITVVMLCIGYAYGRIDGYEIGSREGHCAHVKEWSVNEGDRVVTYKCNKEGK